MIWSLAAALAVAATPAWVDLDAVPSRATASRDDDGPRIAFPPIRFDTRASLRQDVLPGAVFSIGAQLTRTRHLAVDLDLSWESRRVLLPTAGPWRSYHGWSLAADWLFPVGRFLDVGPSTGLAVRRFQQQGRRIADLWTPFTGARGNLAVLQARTWSLDLTLRGTVDLVSTRLVFETAEVRRLPPLELQGGLRMNLGHGKVPASTPARGSR